jgi:hypothetical protein
VKNRVIHLKKQNNAVLGRKDISMKRIAFAVVILNVVLVIASSCARESTVSATLPMEPGTPMTALALADWPMFRYDLEHTGYNATENNLKPPLELKWKFHAKSKI